MKSARVIYQRAQGARHANLEKQRLYKSLELKFLNGKPPLPPSVIKNAIVNNSRSPNDDTYDVYVEDKVKGIYIKRKPIHIYVEYHVIKSMFEHEVVGIKWYPVGL